MRKRKKNSMDWLFNRADAELAIMVLGARNLTEIDAVITPTVEKEEVVNSYSKMMEHESKEADAELQKWIEKQPMRFNGCYVYFRFKRWN